MSTENHPPRLLREFPPSGYAEWRQAAEEQLAGKSFEKTLLTATYEGLTLHPIYPPSETDDQPPRAALPDFPRYVRTTASSGMAGETAQEELRQEHCDPLGQLVSEGVLPGSLEQAYNLMYRLTVEARHAAPSRKPIRVHGTPYYESGGHAAQELAFALATGVEYLRAMVQRGLTIEEVAPRLQFVFALGTHYFMEIAKLRAARHLWANIVNAFGGNAAAQEMAIHSQTGRRNKTLFDPYVNLLRTTVEVFAGVVGGSDSVEAGSFDELANTPGEAGRRLARNIRLILNEEGHVNVVCDPAGGAWFVEKLTDDLGRAAWAIFQEVERQGGMAKALENGWPQAQIAQIADQRRANLATRQDVLVGTNMYPNLHEPPLEGQRQERKEVVAPAIQVTPLRQFRLSEDFEALRATSAAYQARTGARPKVFLANMGPFAQHKARAEFSTGFFEVGGFDVIPTAGFPTVEAAVAAALDSEAQAIVICSTDDTYPALVPPFAQQIKAIQPTRLVILAGYPKEHVETFKAAGVDEFIHLRANLYEVVNRIQQQLEEPNFRNRGGYYGKTTHPKFLD